MKDNLGVVQRYVDDKKVGITFNQLIDADGETIIAEVYLIGSSLVATVNASGYSTTGGLKGDSKTVVCDFSSVPVGDGYSIKFRTSASGVLAKGGLVIFAEDAFSTTTLDGATASSDASTLYQPLNDDLTEIAALSPSIGDILVHDGSEWVLESIAKKAEFDTAIDIKERGRYIFTGTSETTWTIADSILGDVEIINGGTATLNISGTINGTGGRRILAYGKRMVYTWYQNKYYY